MKRDRTLLGGLILLGVGAVVITAIWYFVLRSPEAASEPIAAIPLELPTAIATAVPAATAEPSATPASEATAAPSPTAEPTTDPGVLRLFEISSDESEARFIIDELLGGVPNTVIGVTSQIAGQIAVNFNDLSATQIGIIQVNARTLVTDNNFRNNAISNRILFTDQFEFITFTPTAVNNLPESVGVGDEVTFEIVGDLTIRDVTQEATFAVTAAVIAGNRLTATATTQVLRADYDLQIPEVPGVANVSEEIIIELDIIANAIQP